MYAGQQVTLKPQYRRGRSDDGVFTVLRNLRVNVEVRSPDGRTLRGKPQMFDVYDGADAKDLERAAFVKAEIIPLVTDYFEMGEVVTLKSSALIPHSTKWTYPRGQKFVVCGHSSNLVRCAKLGGDKGRYWRLDPSTLERTEV